MLDSFYLRQALEKAWQYQLLTYPNPAVGCLIAHNGRIVALEAHQKAGTSHAEVLALVRAYETMSGKRVAFDPFDAIQAHDFLRTLPKGFFASCEVYVTLEPCAHRGKTPSCASLLAYLKPRRVIIGTADPVAGHGGGAQMLRDAGIAVTIGVEEATCRDVIAPFLIWQERAFVLFKLAQTLNGRIGGGYISSQASLTHVHRLREVCDTLLIGGDTVRTDRPTLDCRLTGGKAPDVHILTRRDDIDRTIPLFGVPGRNVTVGASLDFLDAPGFVLVEGGEGMLKRLEGRIDWMLTYIAPKLSCNSLSYNIDTQTRFVHMQRNETDILIWSAWRGD